MLDRGIALGYVPVSHAAAGSAVGIAIRNQVVPATVVKLPFVTKQ
jgi:aminomethyltransferase